MALFAAVPAIILVFRLVLRLHLICEHCSMRVPKSFVIFICGHNLKLVFTDTGGHVYISAQQSITCA